MSAASQGGASAKTRIHASCVVVGEAGILIRGASGSGKSRLALALIAEAQRDGLFARLVGDDRIALSRYAERDAIREAALVARPVAPLEGLVEFRGVGLLARPWLPSARVRLIVDCLDAPPPRLPEPAEETCEILGVRLPRLSYHRDRDIVAIALRRARGLSGASAP